MDTYLDPEPTNPERVPAHERGTRTRTQPQSPRPRQIGGQPRQPGRGAGRGRATSGAF
jgi:hypothetical protein